MIRAAFDRLRRVLWQRWPGLLPAHLRQRILERSPYLCQQIGQGEPMLVMRREAWAAGRYEPEPGAPCNRAGEDWIVRQWLRAHPRWTGLEP